MGKLIDLTGKIFGRLKVLSTYEGGKIKTPDTFLCRCECGKEIPVARNRLVNNQIKSCGCSRYKRKHGLSNEPLYYVWKGMHRRCYNPRSEKFKYYGGKGIKICSDWHNVEEFIKWAKGNGYRKGLTIDREDSDKDYCPSNCRWTDYIGQNRKMAKLNESQVSDIKGLLVKFPELKKVQIQRHFGINKSSLNNIRKGIHWGDVEPNLQVEKI